MFSPTRCVAMWALGVAVWSIATTTAWDAIAEISVEPDQAARATDNGREVASLAPARRENGGFLLEELNCLACHPTTLTRLRPWPAPVLDQVGLRTTLSWLFTWLDNPKQYRAQATMPVLLVSAQDRADVAAYLTRLGDPKLREASPVPTPAQLDLGQTLYNTIGCTACHNPTNWPLSGLGSKMSVRALANYLADPLAVDPGGRMPGLALTADEAVAIASFLTQSKLPAFEQSVPAGDATRGERLVSTCGCLNCHTLNRAQAGKSGPSAPELEHLDLARGCLAIEPAGSAARYHLSAAQREDLVAMLTQPKTNAAPLQDFARLVRRYQCNTCHTLFEPAQVPFEAPPPPLTETGQKLRGSWLEQVLTAKKRARPWLKLRMPEFGPSNVRPLVALFAARAGAEPGEGPRLPKGSPAQLAAGVKLMGRGEGGLSCITCHEFHGVKSAAETRGPDLVEMRDRLRADWMRRWWRDPNAHVPGTAMPAFFSEMPPAVADQMMDQLQSALAAGPELPTPVGVLKP